MRGLCEAGEQGESDSDFVVRVRVDITGSGEPLLLGRSTPTQHDTLIQYIVLTFNSHLSSDK